MRPVDAASNGKGEGPRAWRWPLLAATAIGLTIGAGLLLDRPGERARLTPALVSPAFGPATYAARVESSEDAVLRAERRYAEAPDEWVRGEVLARALVDRFRLAGDVSDLERAEVLLEQGLELAPAPSGPALARAQAALLRHDLDRATSALDRMDAWAIVPSREVRSEVKALRGDIAYQRGALADAERLYAEAQEIEGSSSITMRQAQLELSRGNFGRAADFAERAIRAGGPPAAMAQKALLRANIAYAVGDVSSAGQWIAAAQDWYPGFWLADAYGAQQRALQGDVEGAIDEYRRIAADAEHPELLDALAGLLEQQGRDAEASEAIAQARRAWVAKLGTMPDAVRLHAAEHYLAYGDADFALRLVEADMAERPHGVGYAALAHAQRFTGQGEAALATVERAEREGWVSTALDMERYDALTMLGREREAAAALKRAKRRNALVGDPRAELMAFGIH